MIKMELLLGVVGFALMVYCLIEAVSTPSPTSGTCRRSSGSCWSCSSRWSARSTGWSPAAPRTVADW